MARRRFFVDQIRNGQAFLAGEQAHHAARVLRVEPGQRYEISDNRGVYLAEVREARKDRVEFAVLEPVAPRPPAVRMIVLVSLIKFDRMEWILEKGTELGVERFIPVISARSEKGLEKAADKRRERWSRLLQEASEQCRRDRLPELEGTVAFQDAIAMAGRSRLFLEEQEGAPVLITRLPQARRPEDTVCLLTGPEGGWTEQERAAALASGWDPVSLGRQILRAETAAIAAVAVLAAAWQSG
jgi:16S rRNA (uracil1498-N3)-methyltransferase